MTRKAIDLKISEEDKSDLTRISKSRTLSKQLIERANMILECLKGKENQEIAQVFKTRPNTIGKWRNRFAKDGVRGLEDEHRSGAPKKYAEDLKLKIFKKLEEKPPKHYANWDGKSLAAELNCSTDIVWKILRKEGINLERQRSWCVSTDKEFATKAADIVGLYLNPPQNALVLCVNEKPSIQAIQRARGFVQKSSTRTKEYLQETWRAESFCRLKHCYR